MIVATATALIILFGGANTVENYLVDIKKPVKTAVESKETADKVLGLSKALEKDLKSQNKELTKLSEAFLDLHTQYESKPEDFEAVIEKMIAARQKGQANILETRSKMKNAMTREEWTQVFSSKK
jgi:hypothetical protein